MQAIDTFIGSQGGMLSLSQISSRFKGVTRANLEHSGFRIERSARHANQWDVRPPQLSRMVIVSQTPKAARKPSADAKKYSRPPAQASHREGRFTSVDSPRIGHGMARERSRSRSRRSTTTASKRVRERSPRKRSRSASRISTRRSSTHRSRRASRSQSREMEAKKLSEGLPIGEALALQLREGKVVTACKLAQDARARAKGLVCPVAISRSLRADVEKQVEMQRISLLGYVAAVELAIGLPPHSAELASTGPRRLSPDQRWRAEVLARHVARLGERGSSLERLVLKAGAPDPRWHIGGAEYDCIKAEACEIFCNGARPSVDRKLRKRFGVGSVVSQDEDVCVDGNWRHCRIQKHADVVPSEGIAWAHNDISEVFKSEGSILETVIEVLIGAVDPAAIEEIEVVWHGRRLYACTGNRRLAVWRLVSFFSDGLKNMRVRELNTGTKEGTRKLNVFLTGENVKNRPMLSTKCQGQFVVVHETGEVVGRKLTANTYGADLLWLLFGSRGVPPPHSMLRWRPSMMRVLQEQGQMKRQAFANRVAELEATRTGEDVAGLAEEALRVLPVSWSAGRYVSFPLDGRKKSIEQEKK